MRTKKSRLLMALVTILFLLVFIAIPINPSPENNNESLIDHALVLVGLKEKHSSETTLILAGDVMLGRTVMTKSLDVSDPRYPFLKIGDALWEADAVFVNLENPIIENCPRSYEGLIFCAKPSMLAGLVYSGINVVNLANNHTLNYGQDGFSETQRHLDESDISYTGIGNLVELKIGNTKLGFLGFNFLENEPVEEDFELIRSSSEKVDVLVVSVHWGQEYISEPNELQRGWAKQMVEAGADIIAGHHPHWVQTSEKIGEAQVYYSLGNLVFDQMWSENTRKGILVKLTFKDGKLVNEEFIETYMNTWAQPEVVN